MEPHRKITYEEMTPEQRAFVDRVRAEHASPEYRDREQALRDAIEEEYRPAKGAAYADRPQPPDPTFLVFVSRLRGMRESLGLSLADVSERTSIDRGTLSKLETGALANPTWKTLIRYASALHLRITLVPEDQDDSAAEVPPKAVPAR